MSDSRPLAVCHLGRVPYEAAWDLQKAVQARLIEAKRAETTISHVLLLLEHPHVYTLGKSGDDAHLLLDDERLAEVGATFHRINRGGDVTYHGPGQLVGYPLLDLDRIFTDLGRYLRTLEDVIIRTCAGYDVVGTRVDGRTGVWVGPDARGLERKICAMGVHCSRWVTSHGFAFNVAPDLDYFGHIVPCGIDDRGVTSLQEETGREVDDGAVRERVVDAFEDAFEADVTRYDGADARAFLADFTGEDVLRNAAAME